MKDPWGNSRATYLARGIPVPPRGAFMDQVMFELLTRERRERIVMWEYSTTAMGLFLGVPKEQLRAVIEPLKKDLASELFQRDLLIDKVRQKLVQRRDETREMRERIERLDSMSTTPIPTPAPTPAPALAQSRK